MGKLAALCDVTSLRPRHETQEYLSAAPSQRLRVPQPAKLALF